MKPKIEIIEKLEAELTDDLIERLIAYCVMKAQRRPWYGLFVKGSDLSMAEGHAPQDIVQAVISKTIEAAAKGPGKHRRSWNGSRDLYDHLTSAIDSELNNLGNKKINDLVRRESQMTKESVEEYDASLIGTINDKSVLNPEEILLCDEAEIRSDAFVCQLLDMIDGDELLTAIVQEILDGAEKSAEIAEALDIKAEEVYRARKRLRRRVDECRASMIDKHEQGVQDG